MVLPGDEPHLHTHERLVASLRNRNRWVFFCKGFAFFEEEKTDPRWLNQTMQRLNIKDKSKKHCFSLRPRNWIPIPKRIKLRFFRALEREFDHGVRVEGEGGGAADGLQPRNLPSQDCSQHELLKDDESYPILSKMNQNCVKPKNPTIILIRPFICVRMFKINFLLFTAEWKLYQLGHREKMRIWSDPKPFFKICSSY